MYYLDYSAAKLTGSVIKAAGYGGTIRYIAAGRESKQTDLNEYRSHLEAGLDVYFVCQAGTTDADQGFNRGAELARAAKAEADSYGYPSNRVIFFTNDRTQLPNPAAWQSFLDGAASVLGRDRVGAYGFANAIDAAQGHAVAFWQAGRKSDVRPFVNFWQDNNVQVTVGGITCDRNLVLQPMPEGGGSFLSALSDKEQRDLYNRIFGFLRQRWYKNNEQGQPVEVSGTTPGAVAATALDTLDGNYIVNRILDTQKRVDALEAKVAEISTPQVDTVAIAAAIAEHINLNADVDPEVLRQAVEQAVLNVNKAQWNK